jgi:hypothetical protein
MSVDTLSDLCRDLLYRTPVVVVIVALSEFKKGGSRGGKDTLRCDSVAALEMKVMLATTSAEWAQGGPESPNYLSLHVWGKNLRAGMPTVLPTTTEPTMTERC